MKNTPISTTRFANATYRTLISSMHQLDAFVALCLYFALVIVYYLQGRFLLHAGPLANILTNLIPAIACFAIIGIFKQSLLSIGLSHKNIGQQAAIGIALGLVAFCINFIPSLLSGGQFVGISKLPLLLFYYFIVIAFTEELFFRGYLQTRLYGLIKNDLAAILLCGILFSLLHIPYQMQRTGLPFFVFIQTKYSLLIATFIAHIVLNAFYRKTNSLFIPVLIHGFLDFGGSILR